jgi:tRNA-specific 2-thiouridylase
MYYTIGQRKGLGISDSTPYYVVSLNEAKNEVVLGKADELFCSEVMVTDVNWISIKPPQHPFSAKVKLRYSHQETLSTIKPINDHQVRIALKQPQKSVAPGQAAVFYDQDVVLGGGWIVSTKPIENSFLENEMEVPA